MKKQVFGRQFKRDANERKALFKNLLTSLVLEERIQTSEAKAKAIRRAADKLITKAKKGGNEAYSALAPDVQYVAVKKLIEQIAPRFANRQGGYTRIIKVGNRVADNSPEVIMEWVEKAPAIVKKERAKKTEKKTVAKDDSLLLKDVEAEEDVTKESKKAIDQEEKVVKEKQSEMKVKKASKTNILKQLVTRQKKG